MIIKTPKNKVEIPKSYLKKKSLKRWRKPQSYFVQVKQREMKLIISKKVWKFFLSSKLTYELIPAAYFEMLKLPLESATFCDRNTLIILKKSKENKSIEVVKAQYNDLNEKEIKQEGFIFLPQSHILYLDRKNHFLKRLFQRNFDLTLIVDAYRELKKVMPGDLVSISDGNTKIIGKKLTGSSIVLSTGIVIGEINWDEYLDKKFVW
jgi:hypothetical protein